MYLDYFSLQNYPFAITPDPAYLYLSAQHQEALAHLLYGAEENGGFVLLTGEIGTGKTTLLRALLAQPLTDIDIALCLNPRLTANELIATVCDELNIEYTAQDASLKTLIDRLNKHLLSSHAVGRRTVLVIDEAQNLSHDVLEQVRLLTNLETHRHKLLHIMLVGQPELQKRLAQPELRQLAQRITARYHLLPLQRQEIAAYVQCRLQVAGCNEALFSNSALRLIYHYSRGVPRLINSICDRALLGAYSIGHHRVGSRIVRRAAREVLGLNSQLAPLRARGLSVATATALLAAIVFALQTWSPIAHHPQTNTSIALAEPELAVKPEELIIPERPEVIIPGPVAPEPVAPEPVAPKLATSEPATPKLAISRPIILTAQELAHQLDQNSDDSNALERLAGLWNIPIELTKQNDPCTQLNDWQLRCLQGQGHWDLLRGFNRPVLVRLASRSGATQEVLLTRLQQQQAELALGEQQFKIDLAELDTLWTREFRLLWRPPVAATLLQPGSQGNAVMWLRRQLAKANDQPLLDASDIFDQALMQEVKNFQQQNQLTVDGLVGAQTMLMLSNVEPQANTPVLNQQDSV